jgi:hypothetical protein
MRYLPVLLWIGLLVYCIVDVLQADGVRVRALPKAFWILLIVLVPFVGPIAWLLAGRPVSGAGAARSSFGGRRTRPASPDDDPDFLAGHDEPPADPSA